MAEYLTRAKAVLLTWPLPDDLHDDALVTLLFSAVKSMGEARPMPDWARVHLELRRKHVTLMPLWVLSNYLHNSHRSWRDTPFWLSSRFTASKSGGA